MTLDDLKNYLDDKNCVVFLDDDGDDVTRAKEIIEAIPKLFLFRVSVKDKPIYLNDAQDIWLGKNSKGMWSQVNRILYLSSKQTLSCLN